MRRETLSQVKAYAASVLAILIATVVRQLLDPLFGETYPYVTFLFAIAFVAWFGRLGPSLATLALGFLSAFYYFQTPRGSFEVYGLEAQIAASLYFVVGLAIVYVTQSLHTAKRLATAAADELLVKQRTLETEIARRTETQQAHTDLLRRFVALQEEERRRISREMHDQMGQELTALDLGLKYLQDRFAADSDVASRLERLHEIVRSIAKEVQHMALELRPRALDELDLRSALMHYVLSWEERTGIQVDLECRDSAEIAVGYEVSTAIYRVLQEALTNVAKHAAVETVSVILSRSQEGVELIVEDRGRGFDANPPTASTGPARHLGVLGMKERMEACGGTLEIESVEGSGTSVFVRVPLRTEGAAK